MAALESCGQHDTYHLPQYHFLAKQQDEGTPFLFHFQDAGNFAALPFLLRRVSDVKGLEDSTFCDVTSVYGYPGPVTNAKEDSASADSFRSHFQTNLLQLFRDMNVVCFFTRQNPLLRTSWLFRGMGDILVMGTTVAIDLGRSLNEQDRDMTKGHRYDIRKAKESDIVAYEDKGFKRLDDFVSAYNETMKRTGAAEYYFFPKSYYIELKGLLADRLKLFVAEKADVVISASLFLVTGEIIQYHLSGTPDRYLTHSGSKVILDQVRRWGTDHGYRWLHLGGGLGSKEDSLFRFKAGFSKLRFSFETTRAIIEPQVYEKLVAQRMHWIGSGADQAISESYFPHYRAPLVKG